MISQKIALNSEIIPLKNCRISIQQDLADADKSGQTSATLSAEQGDKAKEITVTGLLPFTKQDALTRLFDLAAAKDDAGNRVIYVVGADVARITKIRQAKFFGRIAAPSHSNLMAWEVSFSLREYLSVPEVKEQRQQVPAASTAQTTENSTAVSATENSKNAAPNVEVTTAEKYLTNVDKWLGSKLGSTV